MSKPIHIKPGTRFSRLTVLESFRASRPGEHYVTMYRCRCDCGNLTVVSPSKLRRNWTKSCGCLQRERVGNTMRTHGLSKTTEYRTWKVMIRRCTNPRHPFWAYYGGRGITVCKRWLKSFMNFYRDMGPNPSPELSLDRWDNNLGYMPSNCRWTTAKEQSRNRRNLPLKRHTQQIGRAHV